MHAKSLLILSASASLAGIASATPTPLQGYDLSHPPQLPHDKHVGVANRRSPVQRRHTTLNSKRSGILAKRAFVCPQTDGDSSSLIPSKSSDEQGTCVYQSSGTCTYFPENGTFSSGASNCPKSMVAGNASPGSAGGSPGGGAGGDTNTDTAGETLAPTTTDAGATQPAPTTQTDISTIPPPAPTLNSNPIPTVTPASTPPATPTSSHGSSTTPSAPAKPSNAAVPGIRIGGSGPGVVGILSVLVGIFGAGML